MVDSTTISPGFLPWLQVDVAALQTERLRLEPWDDRYIDLLIRLSASSDVTRFIGDGTPWPRVRALAVAGVIREHWREHGFGWRVTVEEATGEPIGLHALNFAGEGSGVAASEYEIGWWLDPAAWGRGLAREGAIAVRDEGFTRAGAPSIVARIQPANARSLAVAEAIGMTADSETRGRFGERIAVLRLTAEDWQPGAGGY